MWKWRNPAEDFGAGLEGDGRLILVLAVGMEGRNASGCIWEVISNGLEVQAEREKRKNGG